MSNVTQAAARIRAKLQERVHERTLAVAESAAKLHINAPRGGVNLNMFGQFRSAPGEQPAIETGELLDRIQSPVFGDMRGEAVVNYFHLEYGYDGAFERGWNTYGYRVEPRPMGRMVLAELLSGGQR